jgi:hypothetical protein
VLFFASGLFIFLGLAGWVLGHQIVRFLHEKNSADLGKANDYTRANIKLGFAGRCCPLLLSGVFGLG